MASSCLSCNSALSMLLERLALDLSSVIAGSHCSEAPMKSIRRILPVPFCLVKVFDETSEVF